MKSHGFYDEVEITRMLLTQPVVPYGERAIVLTCRGSDVPLACGLYLPGGEKADVHSAMYAVVLRSNIEGLSEPRMVDGQLECDVVLLPIGKQEGMSEWRHVERDEHHQRNGVFIISPQNPFAVMKDGDWQPFGRYVMMRPVDRDDRVTDGVNKTSGLVLPDELGQWGKSVEADVLAVGDKSSGDVAVGDRVFLSHEGRIEMRVGVDDVRWFCEDKADGPILGIVCKDEVAAG